MQTVVRHFLAFLIPFVCVAANSFHHETVSASDRLCAQTVKSSIESRTKQNFNDYIFLSIKCGLIKLATNFEVTSCESKLKMMMDADKRSKGERVAEKFKMQTERERSGVIRCSRSDATNSVPTRNPAKRTRGEEVAPNVNVCMSSHRASEGQKAISRRVFGRQVGKWRQLKCGNKMKWVMLGDQTVPCFQSLTSSSSVSQFAFFDSFGYRVR